MSSLVLLVLFAFLSEILCIMDTSHHPFARKLGRLAGWIPNATWGGLFGGYPLGLWFKAKPKEKPPTLDPKIPTPSKMEAGREVKR